MDNRKMIYLDDTIDAVWNLDVELRPSTIDAILNMLNGLPSAQPEPCEKDIIGMIKKYTNCPIGECKKAFDVAIDYLRSKSRVRVSKDTASRQVEIALFDDEGYHYGERKTDEAD